MKIETYDISQVVGETMARTIQVQGIPTDYRMLTDGDRVLLFIETVEDEEARPLHVICLFDGIEFSRDDRVLWLGSVMRNGHPVHVQVRKPRLHKIDVGAREGR